MLKLIDRCQVVHSGDVTEVVVSANGFWIFSAGADGSIFLFATSPRAKELGDAPEAANLENAFIVTEKAQLNLLKNRMEDVDSLIEEVGQQTHRYMP